MSRGTPEWRQLLITDGSADRDRIERVLEAALRGGIRGILLREKSLSTPERVDWTKRLREITERYEATLLVSEDLEAAALADGVHLSFRSPPVEQARAELGPKAWIGVSTHDEGEVERAIHGGADYVTFGPVFDTASKRGILEARGVERTLAVTRARPIPVFALGGIDLLRARALAERGIERLAVIGCVFGADAPERAARELTLSNPIERRSV
ncbi:MAG: thiamine phosphate synthase [Planctomycetota bacterium]